MLAQRTIWLRLLSMRTRTMPRALALNLEAAGAVHVRVRAMACRSGTDGNMACCRQPKFRIRKAAMLLDGRGRLAAYHDGAAVSTSMSGTGDRGLHGGAGAPIGRPLPVSGAATGMPERSQGGRSIPLPDRNVQHCVG